MQQIIKQLDALRTRIALTALHERPRLDREWQRVRAVLGRSPGNNDITPETENQLRRLSERIDAAVTRIETLRNQPLRLHYDADLPIAAHRQEILDVLAAHQVIVLSGATGSGKSTQLPKLCIEAGRGLYGLIGHTQPRRIAARALANRLAEEMQTRVGGAVGYQVRFTDHTGPACRVKLMTDGILLRELEADRDLRRYDTLIIDEAHERSLNIDLLLGVLKGVLARRTDLKLIVTSATIDTERFSRFFANAPIIEVSGRSYPVEVRYRPLLDDSDDEAVELSLPEGILAAVKELEHASKGLGGDVLVFLPGEKQIRETAKVLTEARLHNTEILPLYARLSVAEQERIFSRHGQRRIVLATNVAETSLTVPGIHYVIDSGLARISRYSVRGKVQRLPIEKISQASADQRKGRCGRIAPGICIRLYDEQDFNLRDAFTQPEMLRTNLASVILKLAMLRLPDPESFPFVDPPELKLINDGYRLLQELKAVDANRQITALGKQVASLPLDPRLARMLIAAEHHRCLKDMLVIAAFLSVQDPRERPQEMQQKADQHHLSYADTRSDFMTMLVLWQRFHDSVEALSGNQLRKWCREQFLSFVRLREWQEVHAQLRQACEDQELKLHAQETQYDELHQAILTGFLGSIGQLEQNREYLGARSTRFVIAPGTPLASKPSKWVVAASLLETTRMYARMVAAVEPQWIEAAGEHLLKHSYSEPHWQRQRGQVAAFASGTLYGLTLYSRRRVNYASVAPDEAQQLLVRAALVEGDTDYRAAFLAANQTLIAQVHDWEARIRRRDLLVDEQQMVDFYLQRLPAQVHSIAALDKWLRENRHHDAALRFQLQDIQRDPALAFPVADFPDTCGIAGNKLALSYRFEPADADDGVTLTVPAPLFEQLNAGELLWLVPGWHLDTMMELMRALPKPLRKVLVPVPPQAAAALQELRNSRDVTTDLARWLTQQCGAPVSAEAVLALPISTHLHPVIKVVDVNNKPVAQGRDIRLVREQVRKSGVLANWVQVTESTQTGAMKTWSCGDLPITRNASRGGVTFTVYPALQDEGEQVSVVELPDEQAAQRTHAQGVLRLLMLALPQQVKFIRQQCTQQRELLLLAQGFVDGKRFADQFAERVMKQCFITPDSVLPRTAADFAKLLDERRAGINALCAQMLQSLQQVLADGRDIRARVGKLTAPTFSDPVADVQQQLAELLAAEFLHTMPVNRFAHLPRYVRALQRRVERLAGNVNRDVQLLDQLRPLIHAGQTFHASRQHLSDAAQHEMRQFDFMLDELRVSLFAQELKTSVPVSVKRLEDQLQRVKQVMQSRISASR